MNVQYNFRLAPEALWLIINTVIGTLLVEILAGLAGFQNGDLTDLRTWLIGLGYGLARTLIGAILAVATGGGFQKPGEPGPAPQG